MFLHVLAQLDPVKALHDYWHTSSPEVHVAVVGAGVGGEAAHVDWSATLSLITLAAILIGGACIQLFTQARLAAIKIRAEQALSDARVASQISQLGSPLGTTVVSTVAGRVLVPDGRPSA
jgi:hypothetical protein